MLQIPWKRVYTGSGCKFVFRVYYPYQPLTKLFCCRIWTGSDVCVTILSNLEIDTSCQFPRIRWDNEIDVYHDTANALNCFPCISGYMKVLLICHYLLSGIAPDENECRFSENAFSHTDAKFIAAVLTEIKQTRRMCRACKNKKKWSYTKDILGWPYFAYMLEVPKLSNINWLLYFVWMTMSKCPSYRMPLLKISICLYLNSPF